MDSQPPSQKRVKVQTNTCHCEYGPIMPPPIDEHGYITSFEAEDTDGIAPFFKEYGFVVVRDAAPHNLVNDLEKELLCGVKSLGGAGHLDPLIDWEDVYQGKYNMGKGFVNVPANGPASCLIRQQKKMLGVFSVLLGRSDLYTKMDRFGLMRPTKDHPEWATELGFVHWDQNPTEEPNFSRVQGVLALTDHTTTSGGFHCIPGSHKWMQSYGKKNILKHQTLVNCVGDCLLDNHLFRIPARRGSLIVWDSRTAHGNWPNQNTDEWREVCYITFYPRPEEEDLREHICEMSKDALPQETQRVLTQEGRRIFALEEYPKGAGEGEECLVDMDAKNN